jgi:hypothetical protein
MDSVIMSPMHGASSSRRALVEALRCPGERTILWLCIAANALLVALCFAVVLAGADWLAGHAFVAKHADWNRAVAIAAVVTVPLTPLFRRLNLHAARANGVRVGPQQFPELHEALLSASRKLGIAPAPELYVSRNAGAPAAAYSFRGRRSVIVLDADMFPEHWKDGLDWITFVMAGALGSICLGHTRWWVQLLTGPVQQVPALQTPLLIKWTYSRDRCAAFVFPAGVRGLLVQAVGKDAVREVEIPAFLAQTETASPALRSLAAILNKKPALTDRARALYDAGLLNPP